MLEAVCKHFAQLVLTILKSETSKMIDIGKALHFDAFIAYIGCDDMLIVRDA